ncbi:MAG: alpha/beta hydrolase [Flavobacteriales bacterium]|nr:alpha/beta hydrolase [Flavobacteriales bacterium]
MNTTDLHIPGSDGIPMLADLKWQEDSSPSSLIVFCHGYKGFKDWGAWNLFAQALCSTNTAVLKFNFSHNGTSIEHPTEFRMLERFGDNNYSKEVFDTSQVIEYVKSEDFPLKSIQSIHLIGHSRGGGIAMLAAYKLPDVKTVIALASVSDFEVRFPFGQDLQDWKSRGVMFVKNGRTGQFMPHNISFLHDFYENREELDIRSKVKVFQKPMLLIHCMDDLAVHVSEALKLKKWNPSAELKLLSTGGHTFDITHPWEDEELSEKMLEVVEHIKAFLPS